MKKIFIVLTIMVITTTSFAQEEVNVDSTVMEEPHVIKNNWGAKLKASNFHLGLDILVHDKI